jgi:chromate transporter
MPETGTVLALWKAWVAVGTQSVGGGSSTLFVIRRLFVDRHRWLSGREFTEDWALSQLSPGIHLVALAGLIGRRIAGWRGVAVSVAGMMIPAAAITTAMTVGYDAIADQPLARAALAGMGPATGGMTLALGIIMAREARQHGRAIVIDVFVVLAAFAVLSLTRTSSILVIAVAALFGALVLHRERPTSERGGE